MSTGQPRDPDDDRDDSTSTVVDRSGHVAFRDCDEGLDHDSNANQDSEPGQDTDSSAGILAFP